MNSLTILLQLVLRFAVFGKTMHVNFYASLLQTFYFVKQVNHATIIGGVRYVETNDM